MQRPYICAACQAKSGIRSSLARNLKVRWFSSSEHDRYSHTSNRHARSQLAQTIRRPGPSRSSHGPADAWSGVQQRAHSVETPAVRVGRYSRKPLVPEQLLQQLDQPSAGVNIPGPHDYQPPLEDNPSSDVSPERWPLSETRSPIEQPHNVQRPERGEAPPAKSHGRQSIQKQKRRQLDAEVQKQSAQLQAAQYAVSGKNWHDAIEILQDLDKTCKGQGQNPGGLLLSPYSLSDRLLLQQRMKRLALACVQDWSERLHSTDVPGSALPSPARLQKLLQGLNLVPNSAWKHILWNTACAVLDQQTARSADGNVSSREAVDELVELWRLASLSSSSAWSPGSRGSGAAQQTDWPEWGHLLSREQMETYLRERPRDDHGMNRLLLLAFPHEAQTRPNDNLSKDYASAALVTLDLLHDAGSRVVEDLGTTPSEQVNEKVLRDFLKTCLELSPPISSPPQIVHHIKNQQVSHEVGARYIAVLTRLGIRSGLSPFERAQRYLARPRVAAGEHDMSEEPATAIPESDDVAADTAAENTSATPLDPEERALKDSETTFSKPVPPAIAEYARSSIKQLGRAREKVNLMIAQRTKSEAFSLTSTAENLATDDPLPIELYEHLILTFLALRHPHFAVEVWNHLIRHGHQPTVRTYTVMIRGARASRDLTGMEEFWLRMRNAGIQPDEFAYSAMIYGLIRLGKPKRGLQILDMMGREWVAAATKQRELDRRAAAGGQRRGPAAPSTGDLLKAYRGPIGSVPRPNVAIINAAVTALASVKGTEVTDVIKWARAFGIEPDIITFNTLINLAMRQGNEEEAQGLLQHMRSRGIQPDSTTWSVLLAALFHSDFLRDLNHDEQRQKLMDLIESTKNAEGKVALDLKGYALIIDRLLKVYENPTAASAILDVMIAQGQTPSTHIWTIVLTSYFAQEPPNINGVMQLWTRLTTGDFAKKRNIDTVFFDRMIEGLAQVHRDIGITPALDILGRAEREGKMPGWRALEAIARALWERYSEPYCSARLNSLVADVRGRLETSRGVTQTDSQYDFWAFIISTRCLLEDDIRTPEDLLRHAPVETPMVRALQFGAGKQ